MLMKKMKKIKQKYLEYKYKKAKNIYIIGCWAKIGILSEKWAGKIDKEGNPLCILYTDHNGLCPEYYIAPFYAATTGRIYGYSFNKEQAEFLVKKLDGCV